MKDVWLGAFVLVTLLACRGSERARMETATNQMQALHSAALQFQVMKGSKTCPTVPDLLKEKIIDPGSERTDPWGNEFETRCQGGEIFVGSPGPDRKIGTGDDLWVPRAP